MIAPVPALTRDVVVLRIAEGGMGYIELVARQEGRFSRLFARKRLHTHVRADPAFRTMLLDEARLAGLIRHPNVTAVLEVGEDDEGPFFMMDYVEGPSVAQILERVEPHERLLPVALCVSIVAQAARGLHAAHQLASGDGALLGVVHRDISPKNLLVGYDGLVRVADFGIAKAKDNLEHTRVGVLKGNIGYMAPEYLRFQDLDCRSDLFALGVVLYELLARERLYAGDDTSLIARRILEEPPPDVFEVRDVPPELASLLFELLAKERELRPPSALAVASQLEAITANLAAVDGPFDVSAFLESELAELRDERRAAVEAALASAVLHVPARGSVPPAMPGKSSDSRTGMRRMYEGHSARARHGVGKGLSRRMRVAVAGLITLTGVVAIWFGLRVQRARSAALTLEPGQAALWAGTWHNCALRESRLWCWGNNTRGQLGDGTVQNRETPVQVQLGSVRAVALGEYHSCALGSDGRVFCWGRNVRGETGRSVPKISRLPLEVVGLTRVTALAAGRQHTCALASGGSVFCWGANESGQLGRAPQAVEGQLPMLVPDLPPATEIFAGGSSSCALLRGGELRCWGANESGQLGEGAPNPRITPAAVPGMQDVVSVALGNSAKAGSKKPDPSKVIGFLCALTRGGTILCRGNNNTAQLGDGTREDGPQPSPVLGISDAIDLAVGDFHGCALHRSGKVSCWGRNEFGAVGDNTMGPSEVRARAVNAVHIDDAVGLALGGTHSCARRRNGAVVCWGVNNFGQLGDGSFVLRPAPDAVKGMP